MARPAVKLLQALRAALPARGRLLLAVSGGMDSVALLHGCVQLAPRLGLALEVAHVNHGLRPDAARDAAFVERLASGYGLPFHLRTAQGPPQRGNIEAWGRRLRCSFFRELLDSRGLDWVLTAHSADDAAETLLMKLVANKEPSGIEAADRRRRCLRPLLTVPRREIESFVRRSALPFVHDETNSDLTLLRNRVRNRLLPLLREEFDPRIEETLARRARGLADDIAFLYGLTAEARLRVSAHERYSREWLRAVKRELGWMPDALRWRFAERLFEPYLKYNLGRARSRRLADFLSGRRRAIELPGGTRLRARAGGVEEIRPDKLRPRNPK